MIHPDALLQIAEQRGCELRTAAHRHRLQRYAASFRVRRSFGDVVRAVATPPIVRRRRLAAATASANALATADTCCCAA